VSRTDALDHTVAVQALYDRADLIADCSTQNGIVRIKALGSNHSARAQQLWFTGSNSEHAKAEPRQLISGENADYDDSAVSVLIFSGSRSVPRTRSTPPV
jgi:hypothetical protein